MQIHTNTDHNIDGREALATHVSAVVEHALSRMRNHITRVEVHLSDENGAKSGPEDKRCAMEARLEGHQPIAVTHHATSLHQAIDGAAHKLTRLIEHTIGRLHDHKMRKGDLPLSEPTTPEE